MHTRTFALAVLVVLAALTRLLPHPPNFAPITAIAIFAAARLGSQKTGLAVPLFALLVSDLLREGLYRCGLVQDWGLYRGMWAIYGATALVALLGRLAHGVRSPVAIAGTTLAGSCLFFLLTNFAVWAGGSSYPRTMEGLTACYAAAVPFFRNAVAGDLFYATVLFGSWALVETRFPLLRPAPAPLIP